MALHHRLGVDDVGDLTAARVDAYQVALDARTGSFLWRSKIAEAKDGYNAPAAPLALNGKIVTGLAPGDFGMIGMLKAFDASTSLTKTLAMEMFVIMQPG